MNKKMSNTIKTSLAAIAISSIAIFAYVNKNNQIEYFNNEEQIINYSNYSTRIDEPIDNSLILSSTGESTGHQGSSGQKPILLEDGNILYYSSWVGNNAWDLISSDGSSVKSGTLPFHPVDAAQLDDGNIFVIDNDKSWYIYSLEDETLVQQGEGLAGGQLNLTKLDNGTVCLFGYYGDWATIAADTSGNYEIKSSNEITGTSLTTKNINHVIYAGDNKIIIEVSSHSLYEAEFNPADFTIKITGKKVDLQTDKGGQWETSNPTKTLTMLSNGKAIATSSKGDYLLFDTLDLEDASSQVWGKFGEGIETNNARTTFEANGMFFLVDTDTSTYFAVSIEDGTLLFKGEVGFDGPAGAVVLDDGSIYLGGNNNWGIFNIGYSFENEIIDINETKANLLQYTIPDYPTGVDAPTDTQKVEDALRETIVSEFNAPLSPANSNVIVYDREVDGSGEDVFTEIDDTDSSIKWTSDEINFSLESAGTSTDIVGSTDIYTIDLEFPIAIHTFEATDVTQTSVQIDYEFIIPNSNPIVSVNLLDKNENILLAEENPTIDPTNDSIVSGKFVIEDLNSFTVYDGLYLQVEYKESNSSIITKKTSRELEGSELASFKTLRDELAIKDNRAVAQTNAISGEWFYVSGDHVSTTLNVGIYDYGTEEFEPSKVIATIKEVDKYNIVTPVDLDVTVNTDFDDPETLVKETNITLTTKYKEDVSYSNLEISLNGNANDSIAIPVFDEDGNVLINSRAPEDANSPNYIIFLTITIILIIAASIITIVASIVIYKKHHFHH